MVLKYKAGHNLTIWNKQMGIITAEQKVEVWFFFSAHHLILPYICTKFHIEILEGFKVIELMQPLYMK